MEAPRRTASPSGREGCTNCGTPFSFILHRHACRMCQANFCWKCSSRRSTIPHMGVNRPVRVCDGCYLTLCARNGWWRELEALPTSMLKRFLESHGVETFYGMQRSDLVQLIRDKITPRTQSTGSADTRNRASSSSSSSHRETPTASFSSTSSTSSSSSSRRPETTDTFTFNDPAEFISRFFPFNQEQPPSHAEGERPRPQHQTHPQPNVHSSSNTASQNTGTPPRPSFAASSVPSSGSPKGAFDFTPARELTPEEVEYVRSLPIRQLKTILQNQKCGDTGCIEKSDLIERVMLCMASNGWKGKPLYRPKEHEPQHRPINDPEDDPDACKICYDREMNCVFLECGHFCACLECGRKMRDCPLCRRVVVRVVEIFKS